MAVKASVLAPPVEWGPVYPRTSLFQVEARIRPTYTGDFNVVPYPAKTDAAILADWERSMARAESDEGVVPWLGEIVPRADTLMSGLLSPSVGLPRGIEYRLVVHPFGDFGINPVRQGSSLHCVLGGQPVYMTFVQANGDFPYIGLGWGHDGKPETVVAQVRNFYSGQVGAAAGLVSPIKNELLRAASALSLIQARCIPQVSATLLGKAEGDQWVINAITNCYLLNQGNHDHRYVVSRTTRPLIPTTASN